MVCGLGALGTLTEGKRFKGTTEAEDLLARGASGHSDGQAGAGSFQSKNRSVSPGLRGHTLRGKLRKTQDMSQNTLKSLCAKQMKTVSGKPATRNCANPPGTGGAQNSVPERLK